MNITDENGVRLLTAGEVAEMLGVAPHRVRAMIRDGKLKGKAVRHGRGWLIPEPALDAVKDQVPGRLPKSNALQVKSATISLPKAKKAPPTKRQRKTK